MLGSDFWQACALGCPGCLHHPTVSQLDYVFTGFPIRCTEFCLWPVAVGFTWCVPVSSIQTTSSSAGWPPAPGHALMDLPGAIWHWGRQPVPAPLGISDIGVNWISLSFPCKYFLFSWHFSSMPALYFQAGHLGASSLVKPVYLLSSLLWWIWLVRNYFGKMWSSWRQWYHHYSGFGAVNNVHFDFNSIGILQDEKWCA